MMTPAILLAAGYQAFLDATKSASMGDWYQKSYQKRIIDADGIRYHITITHSIMPPVNDDRSRHFYTPMAQFHRKAITFNVDMLVFEETPEQIETFFAEMWQTMTLDYYQDGTPDRRRTY